ncbi:hypothetical protein DXA13_07865 [Clostridium sp. AM58-1XD]|nr:hypothetical protein DXA13_07865 [Clostridium sp. AM58-1XD]
MELKERRLQRMEYLLALAVFLLFGFLVNAGIRTDGYCLDDLYLWYCYDQEPFLKYICPLGGTKFRLVFNILSYLELWLLGPNIRFTVAVNIVLNCFVALTIFHCTKVIGKRTMPSLFAGLAYLLSHFSYYQISQAYGLMETVALWGSFAILFLLYQYMQKEDGHREFLLADIIYVITCLTHERFMVLTVVMVVAVILKQAVLRRSPEGKREYRMILTALAAFLVVAGLRFLAMGSFTPAGTGGTNVTETFSVTQALKFAVSNVLYVFGINAGYIHLCGVEWINVPMKIKLIVYLMDAALLGIVALAICAAWKKKNRVEYLCNAIMILTFLAMCIGAASSTIRVEMRWVYVTYAGALFFLIFLCRILDMEGGKRTALAGRILLFGYFLLLVPVELFYRSNYGNLYYWPTQLRANSLAEVTYGTYGDQIFGSEIKIIGNHFKLDDYIIDTFWKPYRKDKSLETPRVTFLKDLEELGPVTDKDHVFVLKEDKIRQRYIDITPLVEVEKFKTIYGYYEDSWMDQKAAVDIFTGTSGEIRFDCYYPRPLKGGETITVSSEGEVLTTFELTDQWPIFTIPAPKQQYVPLEFSMNFYVEDAEEEPRGDTPMSMIVIFTAE